MVGIAYGFPVAGTQQVGVGAGALWHAGWGAVVNEVRRADSRAGVRRHEARRRRSAAATIESERGVGTRRLASHVADRFGLRAGLAVDTAADVLWTLTSPDVADRLVNQRNWGWDRYEEWLGATMAEAVLGPENEPAPSPAGSP